MEKSGGYSRTARKRCHRAAALSQQMRHGDSDAALRLLQRRRALAGIKKNGWSGKVHAMNCARHRKREQRLRAEAVTEEREQQKAQSTVKLDEKAIAALRARYGRGGFRAEYREGNVRR